MFKENLKNLRKGKGLSQEEFAERLHVVRQTISKWEKGLSVPDADMLIQIADIFERPVSELLGSNSEIPQNQDIIAEKLEQLNLLLAERNQRSRRIWKIASGILISFVVVMVLTLLLNVAVSSGFSKEEVSVSYKIAEQVEP